MPAFILTKIDQISEDSLGSPKKSRGDAGRRTGENRLMWADVLLAGHSTTAMYGSPRSFPLASMP